jgi:16S rRNA (cytidine1402-2'-O)-methyltransferase
MTVAEDAVTGSGDARLVVCPTPIGNLRDVTLRAIDCLREADLIACEDTRRTRTLLDRYEIEGQLVSFHEHNERERTTELLARIQSGAVVALVSDAGTPLISDPGYALVRACLRAGVHVEALPGPSSVTTALVASGMANERWCFVGFLPRRTSELEQLLLEAPDTLVALEAPRRLLATLTGLAEHQPTRAVAVCRELTKRHEEVRHGMPGELADHYRSQPPRGEVVLVIGPAPAGANADFDGALSALRRLVEAGAKTRPAAGVVSDMTGVAVNDLYDALTDTAG